MAFSCMSDRERGHKKRSRRVLGCAAGGATLVILALLAYGLRAWIGFQTLCLCKDDPAWARRVSEYLCGSEWALTLAASDVNVHGGRTNGWSSWILCYTSKDATAAAILKQVIRDPDRPRVDRLEAAWILWKREQQPQQFDEFLELLCDGGNPGIAIARRRIVGYLDPGLLRDKLSQPYNSSIELSESERRHLTETMLGKHSGREEVGENEAR